MSQHFHHVVLMLTSSPGLPAPTDSASFINMAATSVISRPRVFGRLRGLNQFSNHQSTFPSTSKKQSNAVFLLGFGLAGLVGFSGILFHGKKQKKITATSVEKHSVEEEHCSSQSASVSFYYQVPDFHLI